MAEWVPRPATSRLGWDEIGQPGLITIETAIDRATWAAQVAYTGKLKKAGDRVADERRGRLLQASLAFSQLAIAMQNERDYEERRVREIAEKAREEDS